MSVIYKTIDDNHDGQRLDNYLIRELKGVPKSRIYRAIRGGEVRVNKKRAKATYKLASGDEVRIPPVRQGESNTPTAVSNAIIELLEDSILYEDEQLLIINKPAGFPVHGGTNAPLGVIEAFRLIRREAKFLELAHRLDKGTSGCLMLAKKKSMLKKIHELQQNNGIRKTYSLWVKGHWPKAVQKVSLPLLKKTGANGERIVSVHREGKASTTLFNIIKTTKDYTLLEATLITGRTHQIRVHCQSQGHPILGDDKYGDWSLNEQLAKQGLKRMLLHARRLGFKQPLLGSSEQVVEAPLPPEFSL